MNRNPLIGVLIWSINLRKKNTLIGVLMLSILWIEKKQNKEMKGHIQNVNRFSENKRLNNSQDDVGTV